MNFIFPDAYIIMSSSHIIIFDNLERDKKKFFLLSFLFQIIENKKDIDNGDAYLVVNSKA
uniref:Uncharacterized protein n=1 Tax=Strongyloides papillosus TaxID=174720 RepID=A0A0N5BFX7_STREA